MFPEGILNQNQNDDKFSRDKTLSSNYRSLSSILNIDIKMFDLICGILTLFMFSLKLEKCTQKMEIIQYKGGILLIPLIGRPTSCLYPFCVVQFGSVPQFNFEN